MDWIPVFAIIISISIPTTGTFLMVWKQQIKLIAKLESMEKLIKYNYEHDKEDHLRMEKEIIHLQEFKEEFYRNHYSQKPLGAK